MKHDDDDRIEQALDLLVFAPLGAALTVREHIPDLVEKGKKRFAGQVTVLRAMAQMATAGGPSLAQRLMRQRMERGRPSRSGSGPKAESAQHRTTAKSGAARADEAPAKRAKAAGQAHGARSGATSGATKSPASRKGTAKSAATKGAELAIRGYDTLSAPQIISRLEHLRPAELEAVRRYEEVTRGRRGVLAKIAQLQSL